MSEWASDSIHIKGLSELQKFLDELPAKLEKNILRGAVRAGMKVVLPVAQANIHAVSGELAAGLNVGTRTQKGKVFATLRTKGKHGFVGKFVEYGTRAHFISVQEGEKPINIRQSIRQGKLVRASMSTVNRGVRRRAEGSIGQGDEAVKSLKIAGRFVGPTVSHPGSVAHAFLRPALDAMAQPAIIAAANYIRTRLSEKEGLDTSGVILEGDE